MIRAAYIGYMVDQNAPSKPELVELEVGFVRQKLFRIWSELSCDDDGNSVSTDDAELRVEEDWGDVAISDGDVALFVTFHNDDRMTALTELGMA